MAISRSRKNHIRSRRSVTDAPTGMPSRSWKFEMERVARFIRGFCPEMIPSSAITLSRSFWSLEASPTPTFSTILSSLGIWWGFEN